MVDREELGGGLHANLGGQRIMPTTDGVAPLAALSGIPDDYPVADLPAWTRGPLAQWSSAVDTDLESKAAAISGIRSDLTATQGKVAKLPPIGSIVLGDQNRPWDPDLPGVWGWDVELYQHKCGGQGLSLPAGSGSFTITINWGFKLPFGVSWNVFRVFNANASAQPELIVVGGEQTNVSPREGDTSMQWSGRYIGCAGGTSVIAWEAMLPIYILYARYEY